MGFQHLDFFHQSGMARKTPEGGGLSGEGGGSGNSENMVMRVIICRKWQQDIHTQSAESTSERCFEVLLLCSPCLKAHVIVSEPVLLGSS